MAENEKVILSGMRPTGQLHLGHFEGVLKNYLQLQAEGIRCYFMIADFHALSSEYKAPAAVKENIRELLLDWLAVGISKEHATIFVQSDVLEHFELFTVLAMITPLAWAERCPTYKEQQQELADRDLATYGFLGYPILQAADILLYRATHVPVGQDQLPHLEMTREIARRFNHFYRPVLSEPQSLLTASPKVPGIDGRKMSKSYGNTIMLSDPDAEIERKIMRMYTDPKKIRAKTPGNPDNCVVLAFYKIYASQEISSIETECRAGERGCVDCKRGLIPVLHRVIQPIRNKRECWAERTEELEEILKSGAIIARERARETMHLVREAMQWRNEISGKKDQIEIDKKVYDNMDRLRGGS
ncbi:tryptophan--tRNA ligase [bacterium]|nr:tryptophan--tRNA ligase [bacterium]